MTSESNSPEPGGTEGGQPAARGSEPGAADRVSQESRASEAAARPQAEPEPGVLALALKVVDVLQEGSGNLDDYLTFTWDGAQTTISFKVSEAPGLQQNIVVDGVNLTAIGNGSAGAIISSLLEEHKVF